MERSAKLQIIGPTALFLAVLAGECAAYALQMSPSSPTLWYLNLVWFGIFQRSQNECYYRNEPNKSCHNQDGIKERNLDRFSWQQGCFY